MQIIFPFIETKQDEIMTANLSNGALAKICDGQEVTDPILQVLGHKPINGGGQER